MHFTKKNVIALLTRVSDYASDNLEGINKANIDHNDELDSTFVGMIIRQYTLITDIKKILSQKTTNRLTTEFILFRCIVDDFIHLIYITNQPDALEQVLNLNGDAINKNFNKIVELATFNEEKLNGNYPYYPTLEFTEQIKEKIKAAPNRQQYLVDQDNFKLRSFKTTGNLIRSLGDTLYAHSLIRAYFIWRKYSDFVHYSNFSYQEEQQLDPANDETYTEFAEIISYSYKVSLACIEHFVNKYGIVIRDRYDLATYYATANHE